MKPKWMTARTRFSLRFLLLCMVLMGLWLGWTVRRAREQKEAVAWVRDRGGEVHYDYHWAPAAPNSPGAVNWFGGKYNGKIARPNNWLADRLGDDYFHRAESVQFAGSDLPEIVFTELGRLDRLPHLKALSLQRWNFDDEALQQISRLHRLGTLHLSGARYSDSGLKSISSLPQLRALVLTGGRLTEDGLASIASIRQLETLGLLDMPIEGEGLEHLQQLPNLRNLVLMSGIRRSAIDKVKLLRGLKELMWIDSLGGGGPNPELQSELQTALPNCKIVVN
jgi:hypothetical protein